MTTRLPTPPFEFKSDYRPGNIVLDVEFFSDPKTLLLVEEFGPAAIGDILHLWTMLAGERGFRIRRSHIPAIARRFNLPKDVFLLLVTRMLDPDIGYLEEAEGYVWNDRVRDSAIKFAVKREQRVEAGRNSAEARAEAKARAKLQQQIIQEARESEAETELERALRDSLNERLSAAPTFPTDKLITDILSTDLNLEGGAEETKSAPENLPHEERTTTLDTELLQFASSQLESVHSPVVKKSPYYPATQRRPMKHYPELWLSLWELAEACERLVEAGIPHEKLNLVFKNCRNRAKNKLLGGAPPEMLPIAAWLTTFCMTAVLAGLKATADLKRSENYERQSRPE